MCWKVFYLDSVLVQVRMQLPPCLLVSRRITGSTAWKKPSACLASPLENAGTKDDPRASSFHTPFLTSKSGSEALGSTSRLSQ